MALHGSVQACGPYEVAYYEFGNWYHETSPGQGAGFDKDLIDELIRRSGCQLVGRQEARLRTWRRLEEGLLEITVSGVRTPERARAAYFLPYLQTRNLALMRRAQATQWPRLERFTNDPEGRVVVVKGFRHGQGLDDAFDPLRGSARMVEAMDFPTALRLLQVGRADVVVASPLVLSHAFEQNAWLKDFAVVDWVPTQALQANLVLGRQRVKPEDAERLRFHLAAMAADGTTERFVVRHLTPQFRGALLPVIPPVPSSLPPPP